MKQIITIACIIASCFIHAQKKITIDYLDSRECFVLLSDFKIDSIQYTNRNKKTNLNKVKRKDVLNSNYHFIETDKVFEYDNLTVVIGTFFAIIDLKKLIQE